MLLPFGAPRYQIYFHCCCLHLRRYSPAVFLYCSSLLSYGKHSNTINDNRRTQLIRLGLLNTLHLFSHWTYLHEIALVILRAHAGAPAGGPLSHDELKQCAQIKACPKSQGSEDISRGRRPQKNGGDQDARQRNYCRVLFSSEYVCAKRRQCQRYVVT